ncbi:tnpB [Streptococcus mitis]|uniref:TnpB n=1 Tax=Streptococcus mitis TaxID=28037 RepID=A0A1X1K774_STRMT|nr:tnpB [Streptococcus mitis]
MAYSTDFKHRSLNYIKEGHSHVETAKVFDVGIRTLFMWKRNYVNKGT